MREIEFLDASIARLDLAVARAFLVPDDPLALFELRVCREKLLRQLWFSEASPSVHVLLLRAAGLARVLEVRHPVSVSAFRNVLLDIAAEIAVRPA